MLEEYEFRHSSDLPLILSSIICLVISARRHHAVVLDTSTLLDIRRAFDLYLKMVAPYAQFSSIMRIDKSMI